MAAARAGNPAALARAIALASARESRLKCKSAFDSSAIVLDASLAASWRVGARSARGRNRARKEHGVERLRQWKHGRITQTTP